MRPLTISLPDYPYEKLAQQAKVSETSLEELVLFQLKRDEARDAALALLQKCAGKCWFLEHFWHLWRSCT